MKVCLKNIKYLFYNKGTNEFGYYVGNCYIENGLIAGFGNDETGFDAVYDLTGKLVMPMLTNLNCNLEDIIYKRLSSNWDTTKFSSLENVMGGYLLQSNKNYYEGIAPLALREIIGTGTGLIETRRCYKTVSNAPCFSMCSYPISRAQYLKDYISPSSIDAYIGSNKSPNIIHGFELRNLQDCDDGSLQLVRNNMNKVKYITTTIGMNDLTTNLVKQKWLKDEIALLNSYDLLHSNTILVGCNNLTEKDIRRLKDVDATIVYTPVMAKTLHITPGNPILSENEGALWCIASGSPSCCDSLNMFNIMQETAKIFPSLQKELIFKAVTINPVDALTKIIKADISVQANFTIVDCTNDFSDPHSVIEFLFSKNPAELNPTLMMAGNFVTYNMADSTEAFKDVLRAYYKRFDTFLENPNMFVTEVPQKP